jgi:hypothetical protein
VFPKEKKGTSWQDEAVKRGSNRFQEEQTQKKKKVRRHGRVLQLSKSKASSD